MYAILETGGRQYKVQAGDVIEVERLDGDVGAQVELGRVLMLAGDGDDGSKFGSPTVDGARVVAEVVEQTKGDKIVVFKYKAKVRYRRKNGHRQLLTRLRITDILGADEGGRSARGGRSRRTGRAAASEPAATVEPVAGGERDAESEATPDRTEE